VAGKPRRACPVLNGVGGELHIVNVLISRIVTPWLLRNPIPYCKNILDFLIFG